MIENAPTRPPLWTWGLAIALVLTFVLAMASLHRWPGFATSTGNPADLGLGRLEAVPAAALHVVALGSSKTLYALDHDRQFELRVAGHAGNIAFTRITVGGPGFIDLQPALEAMRRRPPDLLLLEEDLLVFHRGEPSMLSGSLGDARSNLMGLLSSSWGTRTHPDSIKNRGGEDWPLESRCRQRMLPDAMRAYGAFASQWRVMRPDEQAPYLAYLRPMQAAGTRIVLLELPRAPSAEPWVPEAIKAESRQSLARLASDHGFQAWSPGPMAESMYCDPGHVNRAGREHYSEWLARRLRSLQGRP